LQAYSNKLKLFRNTVDPCYRHQVNNELMKHWPPFLVPAIVEALLSHDEYKSLTFIVPGEAEAFCIAAAKSLTIGQSTVTIFSNDSDLLVYRLSEQCLVVPLRDIEVQEGSSPRSLSGTCFCPAKLAAQFGPGYDSLVEPAFFIKLDRDRSLTDAFKEAVKLRTSKDKGLLDQLAFFKQEYDVRHESREWASMHSNQSLRQPLCSADARISEVIHQVAHKRFKPCVGNSLDMFFPYLLEDGSRKTAWHVGQAVRVAAYSILLALANTEDESVRLIEHNRSGSPSGIVATEILLHSRSETIYQIEKLHDRLDARFKWCHQLTTGALKSSSRLNTWHLVILHFLIDDLSAAQQDLPDALDLFYILAGVEASPAAPNPETQPYKQREAYRTQWRQRFHLAAQYQAMYYSFRILQQLLDASLRPVTMARTATTASLDSGISEQNRQTVHRLSSLLETLPNIIDFSIPPISPAGSSGSQPTKEKWEKCLTRLISGFQDQQHDLKGPAEHVPRSISQTPDKIVQAKIQQGMTLHSASGKDPKRSGRRTSTNTVKKSIITKNAYDALSRFSEED
jgi:hypothetical protein